MRLSELCIERPVFAIVINLMLLIIGFVGFSRLTVRELPQTAQFNVEILTTYQGASAELMENQVTIPIENAIAGVEGIEMMSSQSALGRSSIVVTFVADYDINEGMNDLRDQLSRVRKMLPEDADDPVLSKADPNASPSLYIAFSDKRRSALALTDYVERYIKPDLQQIDGVGNVYLYGARRYAIRIWPRPLEMASRQVTVNDIQDTLLQQNTQLPGGEIKSVYRNFTINPQTQLKHVDAFNALIIRDEAGARVRLSDVADVEVDARNTDSAVAVNGDSAIVLAIVPQATANPVDVSTAIRQRLLQDEKNLPEGMEASVSYDSATFIRASIDEVYTTIGEAIVLVIIVVFAFLGSFRSSMIPIVTIPLCLMATFGLIYFMGYSINTMTLLAMVLGIGLVVDDAIVMLENIHRHQEAGLPPRQAAITGSHEIGFAIVAMTLTLAAVYAPIGFTPGFTGAIFREFAFALAGSVVVSGFVALTLSPMMCAYLLPPVTQAQSAYSNWLERKMAWLENAYQTLLHRVLEQRKKALIAFALLATIGAWAFVSLPSELAPVEDTGTVMTLIQGPTDASFNYMESILAQVQSVLMAVPERKNLVVVNGMGSPSKGIAFETLTPWEERSRVQQAVTKSLRPALSKIPGAQIFPVDLPPIRGSSAGTQPVDLVVQLSGTYRTLYDTMQGLQKALSAYPGLADVQIDLKMDSQQLQLHIDRDLVSNLGIDFATINDALNVLFAGRHITDFESGGENYDVVVQLREDMRQDSSQLNHIYLRARNGEMVPLSGLIQIDTAVEANTLPHYNRMRAARLTANLAPGYALGEVVEEINAINAALLPTNAKPIWAGFTKDYLASSGAMLMTVALSLLFIYLVLSAQFESFRDPFIILLTVPFSIVGAVFALHWTGGTNNIYTQIGFVTLIGLITKHGILITDFANKQRATGLSVTEAVCEAARQRLRPILMTTGAMVLGAIPLALASGAGAVSRSQMGWVIVGGMLAGTVFSLLIVPLAYTVLKK